MNPLEWRYATKMFDQSKKLDDNSVQVLRHAMRMAPSSFGLQPFKVLQITDKELKAKLKPFSYNQSQIEDCSHLFVFCVKTNLSNSHVNQYIDLIAKTRDIAREDLAGFESSISGFITSTSQEDIHRWASKQAYIALGFLLMSCAENGIDACPMEGFDSEAYGTILELSQLNLKPVVIAATGYRHTDDKNQFLKKVRASDKDFFINI